MEKDLTTGSVLKNIVFFSLPYLLSYFLQTLYGMADLFIIGQFDSIASITAVSVGSQVMHMLTVMIVGLAMGATVTIGKAVGGKQMDQASLAVGNTATLFMGVAGTVMIVLLLLVKPIVAVMSTPAAAVSGTITYLTICFIGIPFITAYNIISSIFRGLGDSKSPMYFIIVACGANILLDYLFIGGLHMGAAGAALGTTLSQTISVIVALYAIRKKQTGIRLQKSDFKSARNNHGTDFANWYSGCITGWIHPDCIYCDYDHRKPERSQRSGSSWNCRKNYRSSVPCAVDNAVFGFCTFCTEYWSGQARPGNRNVALCAFDYSWIRYCGGHCDAVCKLPCRWIIYR